MWPKFLFCKRGWMRIKMRRCIRDTAAGWNTQRRSVPLSGGFDHLPRALSQPVFRLDHCGNAQMVCLSLCNYFDADDRDWLFACGAKGAHAKTGTRWMAPLDAINQLDSRNKGQKIMLYVKLKKKERKKEKGEKKSTKSAAQVQLLHRNPWLITKNNVPAGWNKWTFNEIDRISTPPPQKTQTIERVHLSAQIRETPLHTWTYYGENSSSCYKNTLFCAAS